MADTEMVTILQVEHKRLLDRDAFLSCLEAAGVDNWDGIEYAKECTMKCDNLITEVIGKMVKSL